MQTITKNIENGRSLHIDGDDLRDDAGKRIARAIDPPKTRSLAERASAMLYTRDLSPDDVSVGRTEATLRSVAPAGVADVVAPVVLVKHDRGSWFAESLDDATKQLVNTVTASGATPNQIHPSFAGTSYEVTEHALTCRIPSELAQNADFDMADIALDRLASAHRIAREIRVAALLEASASWASASVLSLASGAKWNGGASSDPLANIDALRATSLLPLTSMVIPANLEAWFFAAQRVGAAVIGGMKLPEVHVARMRKIVNGAPTFVWGNSVALIVEPEIRGVSISTATTLRWNPAPSASGEQSSNGVFIRRFMDATEGARGTMYLTMILHDAEVMTGSQLGGLIMNAYQ